VRRHPRDPVAAVGRGAVAVVAVAVAVPVLAVLWRTLRPEDAWTLDAFGRILSSARTWRLIAVTVGQALASCAVTMAVGVPVAWVLSRYRFPGRAAVRLAATVPFVLPSVVVGAAFASLLGPRGLVDLRATWWPILAAHLCFNLAVVVRTVGAGLAAVPGDLESAGRLLGATQLGVLRRLVLPSVAPALGAAAVIVFLFCLTSFGVIVILGGGRVSTVEVEIWTRATRQFDLPGAGVLAVLQLTAVVAALAVHARFSRRAARAARVEVTARLRRPTSPGERAAVLGAGAAVAVVSVVPVLALVERSLRVGDRLGLDHWRNLGSATAGTGLAVAPLRAVLTSVLAAGVATVVSVLVAVPAARAVRSRTGGWGDRVLLLPLGVSATTIGLGLLLAVGRPPVDLRRSWWIVPLAQSLVAVPLVVRSVLPSLRSLPGSMLDSAATLGASSGARWWRVELPLVRRAAVAGAGLALVACLGEFGATVFVARAERPTVPVAISRLMSRPGGAGFGQAMALSCVLVVLCAAVLLVVDRVGGGDDTAARF
jgi:thiamine transport system permease protein